MLALQFIERSINHTYIPPISTKQHKPHAPAYKARRYLGVCTCIQAHWNFAEKSMPNPTIKVSEAELEKIGGFFYLQLDCMIANRRKKTWSLLAPCSSERRFLPVRDSTVLQSVFVLPFNKQRILMRAKSLDSNGHWSLLGQDLWGIIKLKHKRKKAEVTL